MGHVQDQLIVLKATENILQTWDDLLKNAEIEDENEALGEVTKITNKNEYSPDGFWYDGPLRDPAHPAVAVFLYLYQCESMVYPTLNIASRFKDEEKL